MLESILSYGLAIGAVYAMIGITYNVMYSSSRVFSFTAGMLGMLGGVLGALFITKWGMNTVLAFGLVLACGAVIGIVTEIVTVRPVLKSIEQHLYVLSTLAFALMVQQVTAIEWGTEAQPFPTLVPIEAGILDQKFWLPMLACAATILGLEALYRHTLVGRAFLAIAEDSYAARALGLPETKLRLACYAIAGMIGALAGFTGARCCSPISAIRRYSISMVLCPWRLAAWVPIAVPLLAGWPWGCSSRQPASCLAVFTRPWQFSLSLSSFCC